jgi:hypothetical protein
MHDNIDVVWHYYYYYYYYDRHNIITRGWRGVAIVHETDPLSEAASKDRRRKGDDVHG